MTYRPTGTTACPPLVDFYANNSSQTRAVFSVPRPLSARAATNGGATLVAVLRLPAVAPENGSFWHPLTYTGSVHVPWSDGAIQEFFGCQSLGSMAWLRYNISRFLGTTLIYAIVAQAPTTKLYVNNPSLVRAPYSTFQFENYDAKVVKWRGGMAEFCIYDTPLGTAALDGVFQAMATKHGVPINAL